MVKVVSISSRDLLRLRTAREREWFLQVVMEWTLWMPAADYRSVLPEIEILKRRCQTLAVLDAILCPEWEYRYFSFNSTWGEGEMMASMRNGEGDDWLIYFTPPGAIIKGFVHSAPMAQDCPWPGVVENVPRAFANFLEDSVFSIEKTTFCLWRLVDGDGWQSGEVADIPGEDQADPDGSSLLLPFLDGNPETYRKWGEEYFGTRLNPRAIEHIYGYEPLNPFIVRALNADIRLDEVREEIAEIGYPT